MTIFLLEASIVGAGRIIGALLVIYGITSFVYIGHFATSTLNIGTRQRALGQSSFLQASSEARYDVSYGV